MNALQTQAIEKHLGGLVIDAQEWANVIWVKFVKRTFDAWGETGRKVVCRFVSKKVIAQVAKKVMPQKNIVSFRTIIKDLMDVDCTIGLFAEEEEIEAAERLDYSEMPDKLANAFRDVHKLVSLINSRASEQEIREMSHLVSNGNLKF